MQRDERREDIPSSPANGDSVAARLVRGLRAMHFKLHLRRLVFVGVGVTALGAAASIYLSVVGTKSCTHDDRGRELCVSAEWYPLTLQKRSERTTLNGTLHGQRTDWHSNGVVWLTGQYDNGRRTGSWQERFSNGALRFAGTYANDRLHGTESWWYPSGHIEWQVHRRHGVREGQEIWWHPNGNRRRVGSYEADERHGSFTVFNLDGNAAFSVSYEHGERTGRGQGEHADI